jgi:hypothetical protein
MPGIGRSAPRPGKLLLGRFQIMVVDERRGRRVADDFTGPFAAVGGFHIADERPLVTRFLIER